MIKTVISILERKNDKSTVPGIQGDLIFTENVILHLLLHAVLQF